jgi:hypothetical protein
MVIKNYIFCSITPWSPLNVNRLISASYILDSGLLFGLSFDPEDGGDMFLRNVG